MKVTWAMFFEPDAARMILTKRNEHNKLAVEAGYIYPVVDELLGTGLMMFTNTARLESADGKICDIYSLTPAGILFCDENAIPCT